MIMWPFIVTVRCSKWEIKKKRAGESQWLGFLYIPVLVVMYVLGVMMLVLGSEVLKGTINIQL